MLFIYSELTFESHIEAKLGTAKQMIGLIRRNFTCCMADIDIPMYKACVCGNTSSLRSQSGRLHQKKTVACHRESPDEGN